MGKTQITHRRPIPARERGWARRIASDLASTGIEPNHISVFGVAITALGAVLLVLSRDATGDLRAALLLGAAGCIPIRAACNMFDGMVAVEHGKKTPSGDIFNELPDRISDVLMLVAAGYAIRGMEGAPELGWAAALSAVLTAYVRTLGAWAGAGSDFSGLMAKQQRMAVISAACVATALEGLWHGNGEVLLGSLVVVTAGCVITIIQRTAGIIRQLEAK